MIAAAVIVAALFIVWELNEIALALLAIAAAIRDEPKPPGGGA